MVESKAYGIRFEPQLENAILLLMKERRLNSFSEAVKQMCWDHIRRKNFIEAKLNHLQREINDFKFPPDMIFTDLKRRTYLGKEIFSRSLK